MLGTLESARRRVPRERLVQAAVISRRSWLSRAALSELLSDFLLAGDVGQGAVRDGVVAADDADAAGSFKDHEADLVETPQALHP